MFCVNLRNLRFCFRLQETAFRFRPLSPKNPDFRLFSGSRLFFRSLS